MGTTQDYIEYVCDSVKEFGNVRNRKIFWEYMVYINDKPILTVCDNTVFIKKLNDIDDFMKDSETGMPYQGAKERYILDIEDAELLENVIPILVSITSKPKPRKKKVRK